MAYQSRIYLFASSVAHFVTRLVVDTATFVADLVAAPFLLILDALLWRSTADESIALDAAARRHFSLAIKLPSWSTFRAFIERARNHREHVGDGFLPEGMFAN